MQRAEEKTRLVPVKHLQLDSAAAVSQASAPMKRRPRRRPSANREVAPTGAVNTAEARREIATALRLHRAAAGKLPLEEERVHFESSKSAGEESGTQSIGYHKPKCHSCVSNPGLQRANDAKARTVCGHLWCWMCLSRWLNMAPATAARECLVCCRRLSPDEVSPISEDPFGCMPPETPPAPAAPPLHLAMGEAEMAEVRSIGEQHEIEWDDTVSLWTSLKWLCYREDVLLNADMSSLDLLEADELEEGWCM